MLLAVNFIERRRTFRINLISHPISSIYLTTMAIWLRFDCWHKLKRLIIVVIIVEGLRRIYLIPSVFHLISWGQIALIQIVFNDLRQSFLLNPRIVDIFVSLVILVIMIIFI